MKKIIIVVIIALASSCKSQYSTTELKNNFSPNQIKDLNRITEFFKDQMCLNMESDFETCYRRIPHEYLEATGYGFWSNINFEKQQDIYNKISYSTFQEIWSFCKVIYPESGKELKSICAVPNGKYQKYLVEIGEKNPVIADYATDINESGDFQSSSIKYWNVLKDRKHYNLNDPNIQLILAIHFLSLNDQHKREELVSNPQKKN